MRSRKKYVCKARINGIRYIVEYLPPGHQLLRKSAAHNGGPCDGQTFYNDVLHGPRIVVAKGLTDFDELVVLLHEGLHALQPRMLAEEWIEPRSEELAQFIYDCGYRKVPVPEA